MPSLSCIVVVCVVAIVVVVVVVVADVVSRLILLLGSLIVVTKLFDWCTERAIERGRMWIRERQREREKQSCSALISDCGSIERKQAAACCRQRRRRVYLRADTGGARLKVKPATSEPVRNGTAVAKRPPNEQHQRRRSAQVAAEAAAIVLPAAASAFVSPQQHTREPQCFNLIATASPVRQIKLNNNNQSQLIIISMLSLARQSRRRVLVGC